MQPTISGLPGGELTNTSRLLIGPSGLGRSMALRGELQRRLMESKSCLVFDVGANYLHFCREVQGSYCKIKQNGTVEVRRFGDTPLQVYDFGGVEQFKGHLPLPTQEVFGNIPALVVVDDARQVARRYPDMPLVLRGYAMLGTDVVVASLHQADLGSYLPLPNTVLHVQPTQSVGNFISVPAGLQPEIYRHKKTGGIYSVICNAIIEKTGELAVVYRNVSTGERWVRPAAEFNDGRFERIQ